MIPIKKIINICFILLLTAACQQIEQPTELETGLQAVIGSEYNAQIEAFRTGTNGKTAIDSRTALQDYSVVWNAGDQIAIFQGVSVADKYQMKEDGAGKTSGTFEIIEKNESANQATQAKLQTNIALYPYESDLVCTPVIAENGATTAYQITGVTIPSIQTYAANSFADESFLMAALTSDLEDHTLNFKNVCGALRLQLKGTAIVKSIELHGNDNESLSGSATVEVYCDGSVPTITMSSEALTSVTINCGDGVQLNETEATTFNFAIPPTIFAKGFTVTITTTDEKVSIISTSKQNQVNRSIVHSMPELETVPEWQEEIDLFVFAGQSNMMGAAHLAPVENPITYGSYEYKYQPILKGEDKGTFTYAQHPAGDWHYIDTELAYGTSYLDVNSGKSKLTNYSTNTYFVPASRDQEKGFSGQSEYDHYPSVSMPPYFARYYSNLGHKCIYAHMAKGSCKILHYFTNESMQDYNEMISKYNQMNSTSYVQLTESDLSGGGDAFKAKFKAMLRDYADFSPGTEISNKCFIWLQGESDVHNYVQYKFRLQALWQQLQNLGFTHFFILRVGYWGSTSVIQEIRAQEDFCAENENCYIITRAPSLIPHPTATVDNWWISTPSAEYDNCRDSYLVSTSNHHFNEKAHKIFAERAAINIDRILHKGLDPIIEEENLKLLLLY